MTTTPPGKKRGDDDAPETELVTSPGYTPLPYPGWRFGPKGEKRLVENVAEDEALGKGWTKSRAEAEKTKGGEKANDTR